MTTLKQKYIITKLDKILKNAKPVYIFIVFKLSSSRKNVGGIGMQKFRIKIHGQATRSLAILLTATEKAKTLVFKQKN